MSASVGARRNKIAVLIVAAVSAPFSAFVIFVLHIGQASARAVARPRTAEMSKDNFTKRLNRISPPEEDQYQQIDPKPVQEMPVQNGRVNRDSPSDRCPFAGVAQRHECERDQSADQVRPMQPGKNVRVPAMMVFV